MAATRRAEVVWEGDLMKGRGRVTTRSSSVLVEEAVTWASRTESAEGRTSPEELIAAAHASCFAMALAHGLATSGRHPDRLEVSCTITLERGETGFTISQSLLEVKGRVPGIDAEAFRRAAEAAKEGCPVSKALRGNVSVTVRTTLAG